MNDWHRLAIAAAVLGGHIFVGMFFAWLLNGCTWEEPGRVCDDSDDDDELEDAEYLENRRLSNEFYYNQQSFRALMDSADDFLDQHVRYYLEGVDHPISGFVTGYEEPEADFEPVTYFHVCAPDDLYYENPITVDREHLIREEDYLRMESLDVR